jgi:Domain of unknown function (DUF5615)
MSLICLYLDEDTIKGALIRAIRNSGVDVVTTSEAGRLGALDERQLIWATEQRRVIYSFNMGDFCRLHSSFVTQEISHGGIILVPQQRYSVGEQLRGLLKLMESLTAEEMVNQLIFLSNYI